MTSHPWDLSPKSRGERGWDWKTIREIMAEISPNFAEAMSLCIHETQWTPNRMSPKKSMPRLITIQKKRKKFLECSETEMPPHCGGNPPLTWPWTYQKVVAQQFQVLKEKNCRSPMLCIVKLSFRNEGDIKTISGEGKLRGFITSRPTLHSKTKLILGCTQKQIFFFKPWKEPQSWTTKSFNQLPKHSYTVFKERKQNLYT